MRLLGELKHKGMGVLVDTHHPEHAFWASDRIALLEQGRITGDARPAQVLNAETIERLYRVKVAALTAPDGRRAFLPETAPERSPHERRAPPVTKSPGTARGFSISRFVAPNSVEPRRVRE